LRPLYRSSALLAEDHLFISVIAYRLVQFIRTHLKRQGIRSSWTTLRKTLNHQRRNTHFSAAGERTKHERETALATADQHSIYDALGIDTRSLPERVRIV